MTRGKIYNLCRDTQTGEMFIKEYLGWIDQPKGIGYYKDESNRWRITEIHTGCKLGSNSWTLRKEAIAVVENGIWFINQWKDEHPAQYDARKTLFEEVMKETYGKTV